jgi:hypothetical protein
VRRHLDSWRPPAQTIGFRIVPEHAPLVARDGGRSALWPWGLAAAAVLVLAAAASLANLQIRYDAAGVMVTTGWGRAPQAAEPAPALAVPVEAGTWDRELAALEERLRAELASAPPAGPFGSAPAPAADYGELLRRTRGLIQESERRQQREMALRLTEMVQEIDRQRQMDLVRVQRGLGRLEQWTGAEMAQQRGMVNYMVRTPQRQD